MWEDFMRGNWPVAASATPVSLTPPQVADVVTTSAEPRVKVPPAPRRFAAKAAFVAGAAMLLGTLVPTVAVADGTGAHGHHAAHSSRANGLDGP